MGRGVCDFDKKKEEDEEEEKEDEERGLLSERAWVCCCVWLSEFEGEKSVKGVVMMEKRVSEGESERE